MKFRVIDKITGKEADPYEIALYEEWAKGFAYCDMEGFAITEDGTLVLMDECGHFVYCDDDRFEVVFEDERPHGEWIKCKGQNDVLALVLYQCSNCNTLNDGHPNFCPNCGSDNRKSGEYD